MKIQLEVRITDAGPQLRARCAEQMPDGWACGGELEFGYRPDVECMDNASHFAWSAQDWAAFPQGVLEI